MRETRSRSQKARHALRKIADRLGTRIILSDSTMGVKGLKPIELSAHEHKRFRGLVPVCG